MTDAENATEKDPTDLSSENLAAGVVDDRPSLVAPLDDEDQQHNAAAEAEEERLDKETPAALDHLSATAEKFLKEPGVDL